MVGARSSPPALARFVTNDAGPRVGWLGGPGVRDAAALSFVLALLVRLAGQVPKGSAVPAEHIEGWRRSIVVLDVLQTYERRTDVRRHTRHPLACIVWASSLPFSPPVLSTPTTLGF